MPSTHREPASYAAAPVAEVTLGLLEFRTEQIVDRRAMGRCHEPVGSRSRPASSGRKINGNLSLTSAGAAIPPPSRRS